ncbi:hypothetical protein DRP43_04230 [candidate division TA06 bacterium]|uniref:Tetratricopeptide repeat protein n=1 Tax=candidate division TA06 bacterium TaxID=2250710 RepID=A0A660SG35_UNCT6|nr:MAG: hypothetical protein DRP43_04230 [candidate division TA06 bacterium]
MEVFMKKLLLLLFVLILIVPLQGEFQSDNVYIDIPSANVLPNGRFEISISAGFPTDNTILNKPDYDIYFTYGLLSKLDMRLSMFTLNDWVIDINYNIVKETKNVPAFAVGLFDVTYRKYISSGGGGSETNTGFPDENYGDQRAIENASLYFVMTKSFSDIIKFNIGIGRGRFIGMSGISHYFNYSAFSNDWRNADPNMLVGFFIGGMVRLLPKTYFIAEFDGRDANAGIRYFNKYFSIGMAGTHLETYTAPDNPQISARYYANITVNSSMLEKPRKPIIRYFTLNGKILDRATMKPIADGYVFLPDISENKYKIDEYGRFKLKFRKGEYWLKGLAPGYYWQKQKVIVNENTGEITFLLKKKVKKVKKIVKKQEPKIIKKAPVIKKKTIPAVKKKITIKKKKTTARVSISKLYAEGMKAYLKGNYKRAINRFAKVKRINPNYKNVQKYYRQAKKRLKALGG